MNLVISQVLTWKIFKIFSLKNNGKEWASHSQDLFIIINSNEGYTFLKPIPQTLALIKIISFT